MAKKFRFKLAGLLKLRNLKEMKSKMELGNVNKEIHDVEIDIDKIKNQISSIYKYQESIKEASIREISSLPSQIESCKSNIKNKETLLRSLDKKRRVKNKAMVGSRADVKIMEKLKDKEHSRHKSRTESRQLDETEYLTTMRNHHLKREST